MDQDTFTKWENGIAQIPANAQLVETLDKLGAEGWEPWSVLSADEKSVNIAIKRPLRLIKVASSMPNLVSN